MIIKKIFLIFILGWLTLTIQGQTQYIIDSLLLELENSSKTDRFDILLKISKNYREADLNQAKSYAFNALTQARLENDDVKQEKAFSVISLIFSKSNKFDEAKDYIDSAILMSQVSGNNSIEARFLNRKGIIYYQQSNYTDAIICFNMAITKTADSMLIAQCYSNIGSIYKNLGNYNTASDYYYKALEINENNNFEEGIADVRLNIANIYMSLGEYDDALDFQLKSLHYFSENGYTSEIGYCLLNIGLVFYDLGDIDSSLHYFNRALEINTQAQDQHGIIGSLINIGHANIEKANFKKALSTVEKAEQLCVDTDDLFFLSKCLITKAKIHIEFHDIQKALHNLKEALRIATSINALEIVRNINSDLADLYETENDFENSLIYFKEYNKLKDSILGIEKTKAIQNLKIQYDTEKKEQQINILEEEKNFNKKIRLYLIIASSALFLTVLVSIYTFYLKIRNSKHKLQISKTKRQKQKLELAKKELENENLEKDLELKHKELATNAMNLIRNIEVNSNIFRDLNNLIPTADDEQKEKIRDIIRTYKIMSEDKGWKEFELRFGQVHKSFYKNLSLKFPNLSPNEKKICAFLRLNMTTKDIALLTYKSVNTINQARKRLRKKMNLHSEVNLITFLSEL